MTIGIVLLAAGGSTRFGSDKRFAQLADGRSLLAASVEQARASGLPLLVCLRPGDVAAMGLLDALHTSWLECGNAAGGMGHTIADAARQLPNWEGLLLALADMPAIAADSYAAVANALAPNLIVQPMYAGRGGHPVGFGRKFFKQLQGLSGDRGARELLCSNAAALLQLSLDDPNILYDIDTAVQLASRS